MPFQNRCLYTGIFLISAATLLLELTLTRIFDVILWSNLAYLIVSGAIFGFGLGGLFTMLWPMPDVATDKVLTAASLAFALLVLLLIPALKLIPADFTDLLVHPIRQLLAFGSLYLFLLAPFFASGLVISTLLTRHAERVHRLYFADLVGAGVGCLGIFVLPSLIGAEDTLLVITATGALAAAQFAGQGSRARQCAGLIAISLAVLTFGFTPRITFESLVEKRGVKLNAPNSGVEFSRWDPISKIDILSQDVPFRKRIAYDGGSQSSAFYLFDGNFEALQQYYFDIVNGQNRYNSGKYVALAHWLKRKDSPRTLIIGSAGGQETLAALAWGAAHVDAVEMVCTVIEAATGSYAAFIGHIFTHPRVTVTCDEGRSFLRQSDSKYDIIQIHSNHTTASLANGSGGATPVYLQTVEAYKEYLSHLTKDGMLQINYFVYPRMITTAARAWSELFPGEEFKRHLVITSGYGTMSTFLIKRSAWTRNDIAAIRYFLSPEIPDPKTYQIIFAPGEPESSHVPEEFFAVPLDARFAASLPYKVFPLTDDQPFFRDLRKGIHEIRADKGGYVPLETAEFINASLRGFIPMESIHLYLLGGFSVLVATVVILVPLLFLRRKGLRRPETVPTLLYFACLGAGFIIVELVLMFKFVLLIGFPVYAMATVLFTLLVSAGLGSYCSEQLSCLWGRRAILVILAFGIIVFLLMVAFPYLRDLTLGMGQFARILLVGAFLIPIGITLGMPFPLGIAALQSKTPDLIPWAWGMNGVMTVVGSLLAVILSMRYGFDVTLLVAVCIYIIAMLSFWTLTWPYPKSS